MFKVVDFKTFCKNNSIPYNTLSKVEYDKAKAQYDRYVQLYTGGKESPKRDNV